MRKNKIELKEFFDYCLSVLDMVTEENEMMNIKFSYENSKLTMRANNNKCFYNDYIICSIEEYENIIDKINSAFINNHEITNYNVCSSKNKNIAQISSEKITIIYDVYNSQNLNNVKTLIKNKKNRHFKENQVTTFQKVTNLYRIYKMFLKRCMNKDSRYQIYPIYTNGYLTIKISNDNTTFYHKIECDQHQANIFIKRMSEDFVSNHNIKTSTIKPITNNQEYLEKMVNNNILNHFYVVTDDNFDLVIPFDINNEYYSNLNKKALEIINPKTLRLFYDSKISNK